MTRYSNNKKNLVRDNLGKILQYYGATPSKYNWQCIQDRHKTPNFDLTVNGNICCCHCGLKGDSFNVIAILENLDIKKDFTVIIKKGLEIIGQNIRSIEASDFNTLKRKKKVYDNETLVTLYEELTNIITQSFNQKNNYICFKKRNITNYKLFRFYRLLGINPKKIIPNKLLPQLNNIYAYRNIIPVWENGKVVNCILRRDDYLSTKNKKTLNLKDIPLKIFNIRYLKNTKKNDVFFICEGVFDSLSFENINLKSISLNSINMVNKFIEICTINLNQLKENNVKFCIAFDNDKRGQEASKNCIEQLTLLGLTCINLKLSKYKDMNEFYQNDSNLFTKKMKEIETNLNNSNYLE
jgi:hypothetical protein